ncbi:hypothetical protein SAMN06272721_12414 [Arthrobacter sp. P2b]|nr:hypothetical protein SAMN06272721_12414 [Arthrobacter sp. P2b]
MPSRLIRMMGLGGHELHTMSMFYDDTMLHFENEDELRKVGMSKEHRVDPKT